MTVDEFIKDYRARYPGKRALSDEALLARFNEGQRLTYEIVTERGKQAAANLQNA